ncbi:hypothetical protein [Xanthomonas sp. 3058]|uniref:hypothetical protein n=1 Tax=Xanthomonas sp. 3058 TaxID=3035314 RepID=UPI00181DA97D|nr:hypothetical protein [Xanthomonas sp. 3058]MBB5866312.1 hypothetical protein [Xanthomonas sp. 3058]
MSEIWIVNPGKGLGPLEFGMTQAQVAEFENVMGPIDETTEETLPDGSLAINEFRDRGTPLCSFQRGFLKFLSIGQSDLIDIRFQDVSIFSDDPKRVYSTLGRAAGAVFWHHNSVIMPSLGLELIGFVIEYSPKGNPPIFVSKTAGFTWPELALFQPGRETFKEEHLIEISSEAD